MKRIFFLAILISGLCLPAARAEEALSWQDCLKEARKNNPELISAEERIRQDEAGRAIAASGLFPRIDASLSASTSGTSTTNSATEVTTKATQDSYAYGLTGSQLVFDGLKTVQEARQASEDLKATLQAFRFTSSAVRYSLRSAFISLLKAQELVVVAEEILKIRRESLMLITLQYQSGLEHRGALLTAEANLAQAESELSQAKRSVISSARQLSAAMGRKDFVPFSVKGDFTVSEETKEKPDFEALVKTHPSILQAAFEKNAASFGVRSAYANFSPELSGSAGASKKSQHWPPENDQWDVGLSLSVPIFEGGLRLAQLSQAKALYRQKEADEKSAYDTAVVDLEASWAALLDALEAVKVKEKTLEAAAERSKIAEAQYSTGFIGFDNWIIIENELVTAKKNLLESRAAALQAEAVWVQAKGETLEYAR